MLNQKLIKKNNNKYLYDEEKKVWFLAEENVILNEIYNQIEKRMNIFLNDLNVIVVNGVPYYSDLHSKIVENIFNEKFRNEILKDVEAKLKETEIESFSDNSEWLIFKNGKLNLKTYLFFLLEKEDLIYHYLKFDYDPAINSKESKEYIKSLVEGEQDYQILLYCLSHVLKRKRKNQCF